ncbi:MAG: zinc-finger domain-containing protein [Bacillus sp. (in: firmicutes)]
MKKKEERKALLRHLEEKLQTCSGCFLYQHHKKENGRTKAHHYCVASCTVGHQLKEIGTKLNVNLKNNIC